VLDYNQPKPRREADSRSDPTVGASDGQIPSASLFNLISIRHNTETPSFSVVESDYRIDGPWFVLSLDGFSFYFI
jgi:hypothetical protein